MITTAPGGKLNMTAFCLQDLILSAFELNAGKVLTVDPVGGDPHIGSFCKSQ
jgi:hypothetical protein